MTGSDSTIIKAVRDAALRLGSCDPLWLRDDTPPLFRTIEPRAELLASGKIQASSAPVPDMVLLHGLFGALSNWDETLPLFSQFSNPIALQLPIVNGHRSEVKVKPLAAFTEYFVRLRKLEPVCLCGNSLGGHIALRLCLATPSIVDCLVLSGTSGLYEHSVDSLPVRPDQRFIREHMARVFYNHKFITDAAVEEIHQIVKKRTNVLNLIHAARSAKKDNLQNLLGQIKVPTLLLWGENDQVTTMDVAETFHRYLPNSELHTIKNCGHAPMIEEPHWFAEKVENFLRRHSRFYRNS